MTPEPVRTCAECLARFIPNQRQLGQERRGRDLYCDTDCARAAKKRKAQAFWQTERGRAYARARYQARGER
jgi:hypothetical protein